MNDEQIVTYLRSRAAATPPPDFVALVMAAIDAAPARPSRFTAYIPAAFAAGAVGVIAVLAFLVGPGRPSGTPSGPTPASLDELRTALNASVEVLRSADGVEGVATSYVRDELGGVSWFSWRPNGDQVVVNRIDVDVTQSAWWVRSDEPPARGANVEVQILARIGDTYYETAPGRRGTETVWGSGPLPGRPYLGVPFPAALDGDLFVWQGDFVGALEGEASVEVLTDGAERWTLEMPFRDGIVMQRFLIGSDGVLQRVSRELDGVMPALEEPPFTSGTVELTLLEAAEPISAPDVTSVPDPSSFGMPADLPLNPAAMPTPEARVSSPAASPVHAVQVEACAPASAPYQITLPEGWWTNVAFAAPELGEVEACQYFAATAFDVTAVSADQTFPPGVAVVLRFLAGGCVGSFLEPISTEETTIDGHPASVVEYAWAPDADGPPARYEVTVNLAPGVDCETGGRFLVGATNIEMAGDYEANKAILDEMLSTIQIDE